MRIRQIALVARDLGPALADLRAVFELGDAFADPGVAVFGLHNGVLPVGEQFLEVVSPTTDGTAAGRYLARRGGDGGYMVIFQTRDLAARRRHFATAGVRVAWEIELDDIATVHLHPRDTGGALVSVDEARPWDAWRWGGPDWRDHVRTSRVRGIDGVELQSPDPHALAARWAEVFGFARTDDALRFTLEDGTTITFCEARDARGEGLRTVRLAANDTEAAIRTARERDLPIDDDGAISICGLRFLLV